MIAAYPISKRVILCVDDEEAILYYEKTLLEMSGYVVLTASSGEQALKLVSSCEFDAVLLDYEMPEMNGQEIALELRRIRPNLVIILLSGSDVPTNALALVDAFVFKIEAGRTLLPMIADLCGHAPAHPRPPL